MHLFTPDVGQVADTGDDWYTPRWLFTAADVEFGVDVASPVDPARRTCPARRHITAVEDGLTAPWEGLVWCNPPYSNVGPWVDRWATHPDGLLLVPAVRSLWLGQLQCAADAIALLGGVSFGRPDGSSSTIRQALILAARGDTAVDALIRITPRDPYAGRAFVGIPQSSTGTTTPHRSEG